MKSESEYQAETFASLARELEARADRSEKLDFAPKEKVSEERLEFLRNHARKVKRSINTYRRAAALLRENDK